MPKVRNRTRKSSKAMIIVLASVFFALTIMVGGIALLTIDEPPTFLKGAAASVGKEETSSLELSQPEENLEISDSQVAVVEKSALPKNLRSVSVNPKEDFSLSGGEDAVKSSVDAALSNVQQLGMNAVIINTITADGNAIYKSSIFPMEEALEQFDVLEYTISKAKELGLYTWVSYNITSVSSTMEKTTALGRATATLMDAIVADAKAFSEKYPADGILLDGYYNLKTKKSYSNYLALGGGAGFEEYMQNIPYSMVKAVSQQLANSLPTTHIGIFSEAVWANDYEDEEGSVTKADFSAYFDGNANVFSFIEDKLGDFVAVKAYGSIDDSKIPYDTVANWWSQKVAETNGQFYIVHAANKAVTDATGWGEYDQLSRQVIEAENLAAFNGSIFNSLNRLLENPKDCAGKLMGYYEGSVKAEHIMQDLEITRPTKTTYTSFDSVVAFAGNSDPNTDATINGVSITTDANGYFQLEMKLVEGLNTFKIEHKGKTVTYNITKITEIIKEVSPASGTLSIDGGTKITIDSVAYKGSKVYAVINGTTVSMSVIEDEDQELRDTSYARYTGTYTLPDATKEIQNLGAVTVYGEWGGLTKSKQGATIRVNERKLPSDGTPVVINIATAETFPGNTMSQYSEPTYFPLPKGALDYAVGDEITYKFNGSDEYKFYILQSGLRVFAEDITAVSTSVAPVNNTISACTVSSDANYTKVILKTNQQVAYTGTYETNKLVFKFHYTNSMPQGMSLSNNPLFSAVSFTNDTMTLTLRESGKFMGMYPYFDNNGNLVLRFTNPPSGGINGAKIVIDPGHGGSDPGALGYLSSYPERVINYSIASKLASILRSKGANVVMYNTSAGGYSLEQRVQMASSNNPHLFISVHCNSASYNTTAAGTEAYYFNLWSSPLAQFASANVAGAMNTTNRGQKHGYFYVTRTMQYPAILLETGFMSNQNEYHKLIDDGYQNQVATGVSNAIASYFSYLGKTSGYTGTQSTGSALSDAGINSNADKNLKNNGVSSSGSSTTTTDAKISLDASNVSIEVGEVIDIMAEIDGDGSFEIEWSATGDGNAVELSASGKTLTVTGKTAGEVVVTAAIKGTAITASCTVTID